MRGRLPGADEAEVAVSQRVARLSSRSDADAFAQRLAKALGKSAEVVTWRDETADLLRVQSIRRRMLNVLVFVVITLAAFGIANTVLMAAYERVREVGTLPSMGVTESGVLALRNALRRKVRTFFTAGMVVFAVAVLIAALTFVGGLCGTMLTAVTSLGGHVRVADPDFVEREELLPLYEHVEKAGPLVELLERQSGVVAVEPRITTGVTVTRTEEIGDVFALAVGANERYFRERLGAREKLVAGTWFTGAPDELIAGAKVAERTGAKVGDELVLLGMTQDGSLSPIKGRVVGIIATSGGMLDQQVFVPLEKMRWLTDIPEGATELLVFAQNLEEGRKLAERLKALPELRAYAVQSWAEREPLRSMSAVVRGIRGIIVLTFVFLAALGVWNTMTMSVLERAHEIGVLCAMGMSRPRVLALFVGEALAIATAGGAAGFLLGIGPAYVFSTRGIRIGERLAGSFNAPVSETIRGELSAEVVLLALAMGLFTALLGSFWPAWRASSIQPVSAMRSGR